MVVERLLTSGCSELFSSLLGQRARVVDESESEEEAIPDDGLRLFGRV